MKNPAALLVLLFSWCAPLAALERVIVQLDWIHNVQFAGIHWAAERGLFAAEGIEVEIRPIVKDQATVEAVLAEPLPTFGSIESNVLLGARAAGKPVVAIGTMFQDSPMGWMTLGGSGISSLKDFRGKRIGVHPDGDKVLTLLLKRAGIDRSEVTFVKVGHDPADLISGSVDAMQGYFIDEFVKLQILTGGTSRMILARDLGYSAYSQVVFTTESLLESQPDLARRFLRALQRGWIAALADKPAAARLTIFSFNPALDEAYQVASLERIEELMRPGGIAPLSRMSRESWDRGQALLLEAGLIGTAVEVEPFVRQDLFPAAE